MSWLINISLCMSHKDLKAMKIQEAQLKQEND